MSKRRLALIGTLAFIVLSVTFAPASLLRGALDDVPGVALTGLSGTLWQGSARVVAGGVDIGALTFRVRPADLVRARLGYDITITGTGLRIAGTAAAAPAAFDTVFDGAIEAELMRRYLERFDLTVPGTLTLRQVNLTGPWGAPLPSATGEVHWTGGDVAYTLGGRSHRTALPELSGYLDSTTGVPVLTVYAPDQPTPLIFLKIGPDGMATVGITKQFTKLVGQPWMSSEPDHAVVLEVAEKLF